MHTSTHKTVFYIYEQLSPNKLHKASWESYSTTELGLTKEKKRLSYNKLILNTFLHSLHSDSEHKYKSYNETIQDIVEYGNEL